MVRDYEPGDAPAVAALVRANRPPELYFPSPAALAHRLARLPAGATQHAWLVEQEGDVVAWARASFNWRAAEQGIGRVEVEVLRAWRRRGLGSRLLELAEAHLEGGGAREIGCGVLGDADGLRFVRRHGYAETRRGTFSWLEPRPVELTVPAGVRLLPLRSLLDRAEEVWRLETEAIGDVPADFSWSQIGFDEWVEETLEAPDLELDGSVFAEVEGKLASYTLVSVDRERGLVWNEMTGTAQAFRRRGLARLVKLASIRWAAGAGIRAISTGNDDENAGMLALNRELGYRPLLEAIELSKRV